MRGYCIPRLRNCDTRLLPFLLFATSAGISIRTRNVNRGQSRDVLFVAKVSPALRTRDRFSGIPLARRLHILYDVNSDRYVSLARDGIN